MLGPKSSKCQTGQLLALSTPLPLHVAGRLKVPSWIHLCRFCYASLGGVVGDAGGVAGGAGSVAGNTRPKRKCQIARLLALCTSAVARDHQHNAVGVAGAVMLGVLLVTLGVLLN